MRAEQVTSAFIWVIHTPIYGSCHQVCCLPKRCSTFRAGMYVTYVHTYIHIIRKEDIRHMLESQLAKIFEGIHH